jgi:hypothetical protein
MMTTSKNCRNGWRLPFHRRNRRIFETDKPQLYVELNNAVSLCCIFDAERQITAKIGHTTITNYTSHVIDSELTIARHFFRFFGLGTLTPQLFFFSMLLFVVLWCVCSVQCVQ